MSATILRFPTASSLESGLTYVVPLTDDEEGTNTGWWSLYRQPPGADEPDLIETFENLDKAASKGRDLARQLCDRFVIDEGPLA